MAEFGFIPADKLGLPGYPMVCITLAVLIMAVFDPPIFIKPTHPKGDVIVFGKAPELELADAANGAARFGGTWRSPSYLQAYVRAADVLVNHGATTNTLDDIGLPAFYMQRHALELLVKRFIFWVY